MEQTIIKRRFLDPASRRPLEVSTWSDSELFQACRANLTKTMGPLVFALAWLEQGSNHKAINRNAWGVEANPGEGPALGTLASGYGWTVPPDGAPNGWTIATEGGTGFAKPFLSFPDWSASLRFVQAAMLRKGFFSYERYWFVWNPIPHSDQAAELARQRWYAGLKLWDELATGIA